MVPAIVLALTIAGCTKWDDYKKYTESGEVVYAGKLDSVKALSGRDRVMITGKYNSDPTVSRVRIFWNNNKDSVSYEIKRATSGEYFKEAFPVAEGVTTFTVYTYDVKGNKSVPVSVLGKSYGDNYRKKLSNRVISNIVYLSGGTTINWEAADIATGAFSTELEYTANGVTKEAKSPAAASTTFDGLPNMVALLRYRTIYKPDSSSIDTFAVAWRDTLVVPFKNSSVPFKASGISGRWGNLADWNANTAIKSHGGFGGWDEWNGNIFNVESGWGAPAITNGKLWQTFTLPAGSYTFGISNLRDTNLQTTGNTYLVAAEGTEPPDVDQVATALASAKIATGKPLNELRVQFTLTATKTVSIGFITTQPDGDPGKFCNVIAFSMYVNK